MENAYVGYGITVQCPDGKSIQTYADQATCVSTGLHYLCTMVTVGDEQTCTEARRAACDLVPIPAETVDRGGQRVDAGEGTVSKRASGKDPEPISTWLSQLPCLGVNTNRMRG